MKKTKQTNKQMNKNKQKNLVILHDLATLWGGGEYPKNAKLATVWPVRFL